MFTVPGIIQGGTPKHLQVLPATSGDTNKMGTGIGREKKLSSTLEKWIFKWRCKCAIEKAWTREREMCVVGRVNNWTHEKGWYHLWRGTEGLGPSPEKLQYWRNVYKPKISQQEENQQNLLTWIPRREITEVSSICLSVLNLAEKFSTKNTQMYSWGCGDMDLGVTVLKVVSVKWWIQKPDCLGSGKKVNSRNGINEFSSILECDYQGKVHKWRFYLFLSFKTGETWAYLSSNEMKGIQHKRLEKGKTLK